MAIEILGLGSYLPRRIMTNDDWSEHFETSDEWIVSHTGIKERRIASDKESNAYMAAQAGKAALKAAGLGAGQLDMIIVATCSPDYLGFPATANLVQRELGAQHAASFDLHAACTGFVYALSVGAAFAAADPNNPKTVLVIGSEALSRIMDWKDRSTAILFGDGAGAMLIRGKNEGQSALADYVLHSKGDEEALVRVKGGTRYPEFADVKETYLTMDGQAVYQFAVRSLGEVVEELLQRNKLSFEEIDWVVPHQANRRIIEALASRKKWPLGKFFLNLERTANTSGASIPLALAEMQEKGLLKNGQKIILAGFGAGLTWGGALLEWNYGK